MRDEISIVVPIYNVERYITKCVNSLLSQTYSNIKVWLIVDGSPDNSLEICKEFEKKDDRIICVNKENGGYGSVLEYAIANIKSDYFLICDPDDWLSPNAIEILHRSAVDRDLDIVIGNRFDVYNDYECGKPQFIDIIGSNSRINVNNIYYDKDCAKASFCCVSPHSKLYKTEICRNIIFEHHVSYTDFTLFIVALSRCKSIGFVKEPLSFYLCDRPGNTATDVNPRKISYYLKVWKSTYSQIMESENDYLYYRLFNHLEFIIEEFSGLHSRNYVHDFYTEIKNDLRELSKYKKNISLVCKKKEKKVVNMLLNKRILNIVLPVYTYLKRTRKK